MDCFDLYVRYSGIVCRAYISCDYTVSRPLGRYSLITCIELSIVSMSDSNTGSPSQATGAVPQVENQQLEIKEAIEVAVANSVAQLTSTLSRAIDERFEDLKRSRVAAEDVFTSKKLKLEAKQIKKPGNVQQFGHEIKVLEKFESALDEIDCKRIDKARKTLNEDKALVTRRIKLIRIADKSVYGWEPVKQYEAGQLASDSEDDRKIYRRVEKVKRDKRLKKKSTGPLASQPIPTVTSNRAIPRASIGPCFSCGRFEHLQNKCSQRGGLGSYSYDGQPKSAES